MTTFTAAYGIHLDDLGIQFTYDRERSQGRQRSPYTGSANVYSVEVNEQDAAALKSLPKHVLEEYGITEV